MRSSVFFTVLALAVSVSSMSLAHSPDHLAHRRHASDVNNSVLQARAARRRNMSDKYAEAELAGAKRDKVLRPRRRGTNARRCAVKSSSSALPLATSAPVANVGTDPTSYAAPKETSTSAAPTKAASKSKAASKTSTSAQAAPTDNDSSSGSGETFTGEATFYGTGLGACGITNVDTDYICAVSQLLFDGFEGYTGGNPNANPICGKKIIATYQGKKVTVTVTDRCVACAHNDLDFAPSAFDKLANEALGRLKGMTWQWA